MQERANLRVAYCPAMLCKMHEDPSMRRTLMKDDCEYINQDTPRLSSSFLCRRMNLTECCVFWSLIICCFVQISEPRMKGRDSQMVLKRIVEGFRIVPQTNDSPLSKVIYDLFPPIIPHRIYEPLNPTWVTGQLIPA